METYNINLDIFKGEAFCRAACWFDINTLATDCDKRILWLGKAIDLKARQLATSVKLLADRWGMTSQTARTRLREFADAGLIAMERIGTALVITLSPDQVQQVEAEPQSNPEEPIEEPIETMQTEPESQVVLQQQVELRPEPILNAKIKIHRSRMKTANRLPRKLKKKLKQKSNVSESFVAPLIGVPTTDKD